jgi:hypothetical protein
VQTFVDAVAVAPFPSAMLSIPVGGDEAPFNCSNCSRNTAADELFRRAAQLALDDLRELTQPLFECLPFSKSSTARLKG